MINAYFVPVHRPSKEGPEERATVRVVVFEDEPDTLRFPRLAHRANVQTSRSSWVRLVWPGGLTIQHTTLEDMRTGSKAAGGWEFGEMVWVSSDP